MSTIDTSPSKLTAFPPPTTPPADTPSSTSTEPAPTADRPPVSQDAVFRPSDPVPSNWSTVSGVDFNAYSNRNITVADLLLANTHIGFQGSHLSQAARIIDNMRLYRGPNGERATIFLGYTSNLISSGLRDTLRWLVQHNHVSAIVTTAGGVEEDFIKCLGPTYMGAFDLDGATLRKKGLNRIGNLIVPNENYCKFEDWIIPILDEMVVEQDRDSVNWTPSKIIARLGKEIDDESSVYYWAQKNNIPVFCPALTDGSIGDMMYFHTFRSSPAALRCDIVEDIRKINTMAVRAHKAGAVVLGGGVVKHHISNACLMRNGAEWAVFVNTGQEFDGSDAGARPDEAVSWGKIKAEGERVKVCAEATVVFPLLVASTWARCGDGRSGDGGGEEVKEGEAAKIGETF